VGESVAAGRLIQIALAETRGFLFLRGLCGLGPVQGCLEALSSTIGLSSLPVRRLSISTGQIRVGERRGESARKTA